MKALWSSAVVCVLAFALAVYGPARATPRVQYGNLDADIEGSDACDVDRAYETMKQMGPLSWTAPVDLRVRGIDVRIPYRGEANALVGTYGLTRKGSDGNARYHAGTDLLADEGESVRAVADGEIVAVVTGSSAFGTYVVLRIPVIVPPALPCAVDFYYAHLNEAAVAKGDRVKAGEVLGNAGRTGYGGDGSIPTHLHIEMWLGPYDRSLDVRKQRTRDIVPLFNWF